VSNQHIHDAGLIQRIAKRNNVAFQQLLDRYLADIVAFAMRYLKQMADAEDIAQETFLRVWNRADSWQPVAGATLRSWIYRIAYNLCMDHLRSRIETTSIEDIDYASLQASQPEARIETDERMQNLDAALQQLPVRQYTALSLHLSHGLSYEEAASSMHISLQAFESLIARARRTLKKALTEREVA
jgi:RNA polymerase sigma-70 factor (ECF subfamily)